MLSGQGKCSVCVASSVCICTQSVPSAMQTCHTAALQCAPHVAAQVKFDEFVKEHLGTMEGDIKREETGEVMCKHKGFWYYTIGQRKGIPLSGGPWCEQQLVGCCWVAPCVLHMCNQ